MFKFMEFEIKRNLKKSQVKILIGLLLICELVMLVVLNNKAQIEVSIPLSEVHAICYRSPHNPLKKSIFFKS